MATRVWRRSLEIVLLLALVGSPVFGAGFSIFEQGAKAMAMGGAFVAQADDASALFYNPGGLAFFDHNLYSVGVTYITTTKAEFHGADPFPGASVTGKQNTLQAFPPHAYWIHPLSQNVKFGLALNTPFGLTTDWKNPDQWAGRFLSTKGSLQTIDLTPELGFQATPNFGIGIGVIARFSQVELNRRQAFINPYTQTPLEIGKVNLKSSWNEGYGIAIGMLHKVNNSFAWGLSYRSAITVKYSGSAHLTQESSGNPLLDAVIASQVPFGQGLYVKTEIKFPDQIGFGMKFVITPNVLVETDVQRMGWSRFKQINVNFTGGQLPDLNIAENWKDVYSYRIGLKWDTSPTGEWRFGYLYDKTPQPTSTLNPLLPGADRTGYCIGYGIKGTSLNTDLAVMYLPFKTRTTMDNVDHFYGTYQTTGWLFSATFSW